MFYQLPLRSISIQVISPFLSFPLVTPIEKFLLKLVGILDQKIHVTRYLVMKSLCTQGISHSSFEVGKNVNILDLLEKLWEKLVEL